MTTYLMAGGAGAVTFTATAELADHGDDLAALARLALEAARSGKGALAAAIGLVLLVALLRKYGKGRIPFLATDAGGVALAAAAAFGTAGAAALAAGAALSNSLWGAAVAALAASGGYQVLAKLALPMMAAAAARWPRLQPVCKALHWVLDRKAPEVQS